MEKTSSVLAGCSWLSSEDKSTLIQIAHGMSFVADVSRSDLILYARCDSQGFLVVAQARPHSIMPVYSQSLLGRGIDQGRDTAVLRAIRWGRRVRGSRRLIAGGAPVIQEVWPIRSSSGVMIGALNIEANLIAYVRQKSRSKVFQRAVLILQKMLLLGELRGVEHLSPFSQHDGILVVDHQRVTRYVSGIATDHYRKLGYLDSMVDRHLSSLDTGDYQMFREVFQSQMCQEREFREQPHLRGAPERIWIRQAVPLIGTIWGNLWWQPWRWFRRRPIGVLFTIHDATEDRRKERERKIQSAMIHEIHHRVKNNLQTVAALLRMQMRRTENLETKQILRDSVGRVQSMAVVHEYLSREEGQAINIREVTQRIIQQTKQSAMSPEQEIRIVLEPGNNLYLPARQATACALVINELLQNALEHGFEGNAAGTIVVELLDDGDKVRIVIADDGAGLPPGFRLEDASSLGLQIVQTLVKDDLQGAFEMNSNGGVRAIVEFSKKVLEGEASWNAQE